MRRVTRWLSWVVVAVTAALTLAACARARSPSVPVSPAIRVLLDHHDDSTEHGS